MPHDPTPTVPFASAATLRQQIGWLCQSVRFFAAAYAIWVPFSVIALWLDRDQVAKRYGSWLHADLSGISDWQIFAGFSLHAVICIFVVGASYSTWRLFSGFLAGDVFTSGAAALLRKIALFGLIAEGLDILQRPLMAMIVSAHLPPGQRMIGIAVNQNDVAFLMFLSAFLALGHIFKKAAEIAAENESIV